MLTRRKRLLAPVLLATAGLALAGCGGGGGGDEDAYVDTIESACKEITGVQTNLQKNITAKVADAGSDQAKVLAAVKEVAGDAFGTLDAQFKKLADADAPDKWSDFQGNLKKAAESVSKSFADAQEKLKNAKTGQDLSTLGQGLQNTDLPDTKAPKDLQDKVPACEGLTS